MQLVRGMNSQLVGGTNGQLVRGTNGWLLLQTAVFCKHQRKQSKSWRRSQSPPQTLLWKTQSTGLPLTPQCACWKVPCFAY